MCLTIPVQIHKILNKDSAQIISRGEMVNINTKLLGNLKIGDWILTQADLAINKITEAEAIEINKIFKKD